MTTKDTSENPTGSDADALESQIAETRPQRDSKEYDAFLHAVVKSGASDLHLKAGEPPRVRINGVLRKVDREPRPVEEFEAMVLSVLSDEQRRQVLEDGSTDFAYDLDGEVRFRVNVFRQDSGLSVAARLVSRVIPSFEKLHMPPVVEKIAENRQGLVLVSGITGSGKSTTIAAMLEHINATRSDHIVTIEDPIEYLFTQKKCLINQREIGINVKDFATALRALLREDPDVVLIGEMRDTETFRAALQAAGTGHLVFGTVHASTATQTIGRLLDLFPESERNTVRQSLVFNLRAIIAQKLLPSIKEDVGRVPAVEILINTPIVQKLIGERRDVDLIGIVASGEEGMQSFSECLYNLYNEGLIDKSTARSAAPNPDEFEMRLKGIRSSQGNIMG